MEVGASQKAPEGWNGLVDSDEAGTFFQRSDWPDVLIEGGIGAEAVYLSLTSGGRPLAGLPAVAIRRGPVRILASMPLGTYGGPVLGPHAPPDAVTVLLDAFRRLASRHDVGAAHLMDESGRLEAPPPGFSAHTENAHRVRLDRPFEDVWSSFRPSARNKVRKARKAGVVVRRASSETDFLIYADMLDECVQRWGERSVFGRSFFSALSRLSPDVVQMWLAEHEGTAIGGDLNFTLHGRIMNWGNVSRTSARKLAPNNLLHATAMEEGAREGAVVYDLGSSAGIESVDAFKSAFGTTLVELRMYSVRKWWFSGVRRVARLREHGRSG